MKTGTRRQQARRRQRRRHQRRLIKLLDRQTASNCDGGRRYRIDGDGVC